MIPAFYLRKIIDVTYMWPCGGEVYVQLQLSFPLLWFVFFLKRSLKTGVDLTFNVCLIENSAHMFEEGKNNE